MKQSLLGSLILLAILIGRAEGEERLRLGLGSISLPSGLVPIAEDRGLSQLSGAPGVAANLEGGDLVYFLGLLDKLNYPLVARPEIKSVEQLKGEKFAVSRFGSSADFGMRAVLKRLGVDPVKEAMILQIGDEPARIAAVTSGNVDGTVANAPFARERAVSMRATTSTPAISNGWKRKAP